MATWTSQRTGRWNDDAANGTSPWNGGANPASGVPANTDTVTIAAGHDVEFDADQSGFAAGITLTITGTLHASTTAGSYKLKMQANMTGAGTLRAGTSGTPYPTNCTFEIIRNGFQITASSMTLDLNCSEPTVKWIKLTAQEAAAQTVLSVDTDVSADPYWVSGATLRINDVNGGNDSEERTFSSATATTITITSGLTAQKETGTYIALMSRNVKITHTTAAGQAVATALVGRLFAEINFGTTGINNSTIDIGGTINNCSTAMTLTKVGNISAVICGSAGTLVNAPTGSSFLSTSLIAGGANGVNSASGCSFFGTIAGCVNGINASYACLVYGSIRGCGSGILSGGGFVGANATLTNTVDISSQTQSKFSNCLFGGTTENSGYNGVGVGIDNFVESIDHDQTANQYRAWTKGGIIDSDTGTVYTGRTRSYKHACASASFYAFQNRTFTVQPGGGLVVQCYVRKTVTMTYLPRIWILTPGQEPFITGSPAYEDIMTDSVDTWEELNLVYANGGSSPVDVVVRTVAKNASGNVFFDPIVTVLAPATYDVYNTLLANVAAILVDTNELQTDWVNGGRLDNILDARASQTSVDDLPTNAELTTALGTADDAVLAQVALVKTETDKIASIKAKTDSLTFTVAGQVDANVQSVNDTELTGDGSGTPWGPA
jgi:hypothetical protein